MIAGSRFGSREAGTASLRHTLEAMLAAEGASAATGVAGCEVAVDVDRRFQFFGIRITWISTVGLKVRDQTCATRLGALDLRH
jgi:hypothetical protein